MKRTTQILQILLSSGLNLGPNVVSLSKWASSPWVHSHNRTKIHWINIFFWSLQDLLDYQSIGPFSWMKWIPKNIFISIWTQIRQRRAKAQPVIRALSTTRFFWGPKSCSDNKIWRENVLSIGRDKKIRNWKGKRHTKLFRIGDEIHMHLISVGCNEHIFATLIVELCKHFNKLRVEEWCSLHQFLCAFASSAMLRQLSRDAPQRSRPSH